MYNMMVNIKNTHKDNAKQKIGSMYFIIYKIIAQSVFTLTYIMCECVV